MKTIFITILTLVSTMLCASQITVTRTLTYQGSMHDSEVQAAERALDLLRKEWLETIGVLMVSDYHVRINERDGSSENHVRDISQFAMGRIETNIISSSWDGRIYHVIAELTADTAEIQRDLEGLRMQWKQDKSRERELNEREREMERNFRQREGILQVREAAVREKELRVKELPREQPTSQISQPTGRSSRCQMPCKYLAWGIVTASFPSTIGTSFYGRLGGIYGIGFYAGLGADVGIKNHTLARTTPIHYSMGLKFFPYKNLFISGGYGTLGMFFDDDGKENFLRNDDGWRQKRGTTLMIGYNFLWDDTTSDRINTISISAGISRDNAGSYLPSITLRIGTGWK